jgi:hypothetical protein
MKGGDHCGGVSLCKECMAEAWQLATGGGHAVLHCCVDGN